MADKIDNLEHDPAYKRIWSDPAIVRSYFKYAKLPSGLFARLDFSTLREVSSELVSDKLSRRFGDMIWQVDFKDRQGQLHLILHIEFQSRPDSSMPFRMLSYAALIYESLWNNKMRPKRATKLPTVISTVIYTGTSRWNVPLEVRELLGSDAVELQPSFRYLVIDEKQLVEDGATNTEDLAGAFMILRHSREYAMIKDAETRIVESESYRSNPRAYDKLARAVGLARLGKEVHTMEELTSVLDDFERYAERRWKPVGVEEGFEQGVAQGIEQGVAQGIEQGVAQGKRLVAKQMLSKGWTELDIVEYTGLSLKQIHNLKESAGKLSERSGDG